MEMKAMMFAGGGLFLSMVATTIWISGDVSRMRAEERAKDAQKCAMAQQADVAQAQTTTNTAPASDFSTPAAPQADAACADATGTGDPAAGQPAVDPITGQPLDQVGGQADPNAASADGQTFQPSEASFDPATGLPVDPAAAPAPTGQPTTTGDPGFSTDPLASQGATGVPTGGGVAEAGF